MNPENTDGDRYWQLAVFTGGPVVYLYGNRAVLRRAIQEWLAWREDLTSAKTTLSVSGMTNSMDRAESDFRVDAETITAMQLTKWS